MSSPFSFLKLRPWAVFAGLSVAVAVTADCAGDPLKARDRFLASGDGYASQGKPAEAIIEYRNAIEHDPLYAPVRIKLAESYLRVGNVQGAAGEYVRAADLTPKDADLQVNAGAFLLMLGRPQDAMDRARRALALNPRHARAQVLLSGALANLKDFGGALAAINKAIELEPRGSGSYAALGALQLEQGHVAESERALERAVSLDPTSTAVRLLLARFYFVTGRPADAEREFRRAVALAPRDPAVNRAIASFLIASRRLPEAEPFLRAIAEVTNALDAELMLADFYAATGRADEASALLEPLTRDRASFGPANVRLATLAYAAGRRDEAHARLRDVLKREPANATGLAVSAEFLLAERRYPDALRTATAAVEADPAQWRVHGLLGRIHAARQDSTKAIEALLQALRLQPANVGILRELARLTLAVGNTERAIGFSEDAINAGDRSPETQLVLVRALLARRDLDRARRELERLALEAPRVPGVHVERGVLYGLAGDRRGSRAAFDQALSLDPNSTEAFSGLAALDVSEKQGAAAHARATAWISAHPDDPGSLLAAARAFAAAGDRGKAELLLRRLIDRDANNLAAYIALGQTYVASGRLDDAVREFDALASHAPQPAAALTMSGSILQAQGRVEEARRRFERALRADSRAAVAANNLAWIYAESGEQLEIALQLAQVAKEQLGETPEVLDTLGWVYLKKDLPTVAIPLFEENARRDPANAGYQHHLGLAYARAGDLGRARGALQRAVELAPDLTAARDALSTLPSRNGGTRGQ